MRGAMRIPGLPTLPTLASFLGGGFSPASLFSGGVRGAWYDPSDLTTLFQDTAGTTPVTAAGQSVALVLDKSGRGNHATQATAASRPTYQVVSGLPCLVFDGVDDFLVTATITPGTDKVQVFAGVRKLSDAASGIVVELSASLGANNGAMYLINGNASGTPGYAGYNFASKGTLSVNATSPASFAAPITNVLTGIGDIAADTAILRINGTQAASGATDQGTGNYRAYPVYIGRRGGTTLPFNGRLYGLITRFGANLTADQISQAERWMAQRTGVTL